MTQIVCLCVCVSVDGHAYRMEYTIELPQIPRNTIVTRQETIKTKLNIIVRVEKKIHEKKN